MPTVKEDGFKLLKGHIHIKSWEKQKNGTEKLVEDRDFDNLIVTDGKISILKNLGGPTIACCTDSGYTNKIGVGDSSAAPVVGDTGLQGCCTFTKVIATADKSYACATLFVSIDVGYCCGNIGNWNELAIFDNNCNLIARQVDCTPLNKTSCKRAIVEWQFSI